MALETITLSGIHATSISNAELIAKNGFQPGKVGRCGPGAYFWKKSHLDMDLAKGWHRHAYERGDYYHSQKRGLAVVRVEIEVLENQFVDLSSGDFQEPLQKFLQEKRGVTLNTPEEISNFYDLFLEMLAQKLQTDIKVVQALVPAPDIKYLKVYNQKVLGYPACYVVRDTKCVKIVKDK